MPELAVPDKPSAPAPGGWSFAAGPCRLPDPVLRQAAETLFVRDRRGVAQVEQPFSGDRVRARLAAIEARLLTLLELPRHYRILFLAGGASAQFGLLAQNLGGCRARDRHRHATYIDSGYWSQRAASAAARFVPVRRIGFCDDLEARLRQHLRPDCAWLHVTPNETADGMAWPIPDGLSQLLVADASSALCTMPLAGSRCALLYASTQKSLGVAGMSLVIVREDALPEEAPLPAPLCYRRQMEAGSCVSTPPLLAIEMLALMLDWIEGEGGCRTLYAANARKAARLYALLDASAGFYSAPVPAARRSPVNIRFHLATPALEAQLLASADAAGFFDLAGHPRVGGLRATLANSLPEAAVTALCDFLADFARRHG